MLKLVEKGTKYERLQAQQAKAQKRLAQAEQARVKITEELAQALADESPEKTQSLRAQLRALDELREDAQLELGALEARLRVGLADRDHHCPAETWKLDCDSPKDVGRSDRLLHGDAAPPNLDGGNVLAVGHLQVVRHAVTGQAQALPAVAKINRANNRGASILISQFVHPLSDCGEWSFRAAMIRLGGSVSSCRGFTLPDNLQARTPRRCPREAPQPIRPGHRRSCPES